MPPPAAASHTASIHLLRALLREATYLPDPHARKYFTRFIVGRFKAYQPRRNATASALTEAIDRHRHRASKRHPERIIHARTPRLQRVAQKSLHYLRRANHGEIPCLLKILFFTYGRAGRRKHALIDDILRPDSVTDGGRVVSGSELCGPAPLQELYYSKMPCLKYFDAPKPASNGMQVIGISDHYSRLRAVVKSQSTRGISMHRELKGPAMKTPVHNAWMQPMPIVRARNNVRRWYAETMKRLLPPLPTEEWHHLHALAEGTDRVSIVRRRKPGTWSEQEEFDPIEHAMNVVTDGLKMDKLSRAVRPAGLWRPHNITPKFMRRLYSRVLQLCCKVEYDPERQQWVATWGQAIKTISPKIYQTASEPSLFHGVDNKGKILTAPRKPKGNPDPELQPRNDKGEYVRFPFFTEYLPEDNPLRKELEAWKKKRIAAGIIDEDGTFCGR
ncbi:hypothetical protein BDU57DRAFT_521790 [Ampelomyces quisqualis]|uniref:LYR motif-containing protein Cup1-like N-terminal domain-containing protein n=1 Tax=Ampelomyces quisqualis TaxID=50730 RepID=A0A6A5QE81_AMPQU|nr:hypothetical protein BDU57DRAFT_521790 [Ampelomyces quisqualis]